MNIKFLNRKLKDALGVSPAGDALFCWRHTGDLTVRQLEKDGYMDVPQISDEADPMKPANRWAVAVWLPPMHTREQYRAAFGNSMPYPRNGRYTVTDIVLRVGQEPTEWMTDEVIGAEKLRRYRTAVEQQRLFEDRRAKADADKRRVSSDILMDAQLPFKHVPGTKDNVSIGGL
jgi:hypothetical protein